MEALSPGDIQLNDSPLFIRHFMILRIPLRNPVAHTLFIFKYYLHL